MDSLSSYHVSALRARTASSLAGIVRLGVRRPDDRDADRHLLIWCHRLLFGAAAIVSTYRTILALDFYRTLDGLDAVAIVLLGGGLNGQLAVRNDYYRLWFYLGNATVHARALGLRLSFIATPFVGLPRGLLGNFSIVATYSRIGGQCTGSVIR